jgi:hypothetical protein
MLSAAEQVARIASDFRDNGNIIKQHLGTDDWDDVYPVVLNAMPFSLPIERGLLFRCLSFGSILQRVIYQFR